MSRIGDALRRSRSFDPAEGTELTDVVDLPLEVPAPDDTPFPIQESPGVEVLGDPSQAPVRAGSLGADPLYLGGAEKLVANPQVQPVAVEQYRRLAAILHHVQEEREVRKVLVSSAFAEEGKTLTASNLALTLSESYGRRVLLIDADLRRPGVGLAMQLPNGTGLSEALASEDDVKLPVLQLSPCLSVLPAGRPTRDPMQGLTSARMQRILDEAADAFDWVIVDSPPVGVLPDAKLLARMVDAALLVVAANRTPCAAIQRAADAIGREKILGVVLNRVDPKVASPSDYYYRYYAAEGNGQKRNGFFSKLFRRS